LAVGNSDADTFLFHLITLLDYILHSFIHNRKYKKKIQLYIQKDIFALVKSALWKKMRLLTKHRKFESNLSYMLKFFKYFENVWNTLWSNALISRKKYFISMIQRSRATNCQIRSCHQNETCTADTPRSVVCTSIYFRAISFAVLFLQWFDCYVAFQHEVKRCHGSVRYDIIFLTLTVCK
jgi:hypothetical protein